MRDRIQRLGLALRTVRAAWAKGGEMPEKLAGGKTDDDDTGVGNGPVAPAVIAICSVFFVGLGLLLLYALWKFFPAVVPAGQTAPATTDYRFLWGTFTLTPEKDLLVAVALAGGVGAMAYVLRSFFKYVGERLLRNSWLLSYFLIPLVGAIMATIVYIVIRGGLISGGGIDQTNPFGFAAVAVLVGLFSAQAAEKLKQVFETLFAAPPAGKDALPPKDQDKPAEGAGAGAGAGAAAKPVDAAGGAVAGGGAAAAAAGTGGAADTAQPGAPEPPDDGTTSSAGGDT